MRSEAFLTIYSIALLFGTLGPLYCPALYYRPGGRDGIGCRFTEGTTTSPIRREDEEEERVKHHLRSGFEALYERSRILRLTKPSERASHCERRVVARNNGTRSRAAGKQMLLTNKWNVVIAEREEGRNRQTVNGTKLAEEEANTNNHYCHCARCSHSLHWISFHGDERTLSDGNGDVPSCSSFPS